MKEFVGQHKGNNNDAMHIERIQRGSGVAQKLVDVNQGQDSTLRRTVRIFENALRVLRDGDMWLFLAIKFDVELGRLRFVFIMRNERLQIMKYFAKNVSFLFDCHDSREK